MASRVNTRFVVILSTGLALVCVGMGAVAWHVLTKSGEDYVERGDAAAASGDWAAAAQAYGRAVGHDQTRVDWMAKWAEALEQTTPPDRLKYEEGYQQYVAVLQSIAKVKRTDLQAWRKAIEERLKPYRIARLRKSDVEALSRALLEDAIHEMERAGEGAGDVLRGYRGEVLVRAAVSGAEVSRDELAAAREDLEAALAAEPGFVAAAVARADLAWHEYDLATQQNPRVRMADVAAGLEAGRAPLAEAVRLGREGQISKADAAFAEAALLAYDVQIAREEVLREVAVAGRTPDARTVEQIAEATQRFAERLEGVTQQFIEADPGSVPPSAFQRLQAAELRVTNQSSVAQSRAAIEAHLDAHPRRALLLNMLVEMANAQGDAVRAATLARELQQLTVPPLTYGGVEAYRIRPEGYRLEARSRIAQMPRVAPEERRKVLESATAARDAFVREVGAQDLRVVLLDAHIAAAEADAAQSSGDRIAAVRRSMSLVQDYNRRSDSGDREALRLESHLALVLGMENTALEQLRRLDRMDALDANGAFNLIRLLQARGETDQANELIARAVRRFPGDERLAEFAAATDGSDPVLALLTRAQQTLMSTPGAAAQVEADLRAALRKHDHDPRIVQSLSQMLLSQDRFSEIQDVVRAAAAARPNDEQLASAAAALNAGNLIDYYLQALERSDLAPGEKALLRHRFYRQQNMRDEAAAALAEARAAGAPGPALLLAELDWALATHDLAGARRAAEQAAAANLDGVNGASFQAQVALLEAFIAQDRDTRSRKLAEAIALLRRAIDNGARTADVRYRLAQAYSFSGDKRAALRAIDESLAENYRDVRAINFKLELLGELNRIEEALAVAEDASAFAAADDRFQQLWIALLSQAGGEERRTRATELALTIERARPNDPVNTLMLANLFTESRRWADAKQRLDRLEADGRSLQEALAWASWYAGQPQVTFDGRPTKGLDAARAVLEQHAQTAPTDAERLQTWLSAAQFLRERGDRTASLAALERAVPLQGPDRRADVIRAQLLFTDGAFAEAAALARELVAAGNTALRSLLADALLRSGRAEEALAELRSGDEAWRATLPVRLLRAQTLAALDRKQEAAAELDAAVRAAPEDPLVYVLRAELAERVGRPQADAMADIQAALGIDPTNVQALRVRGRLRLAAGDRRRGLDDMLAAALRSPQEAPYAVSVISELLVDARDNDAATLATAVTTALPENIPVHLVVAEAFLQAGYIQRAEPLLDVSWNRTQNPEVGLVYAQVILSGPQERESQKRALARRAVDVIRRIESLAPEFGRGFPAQVALARAEALQGRPREAELALHRALAASGEDTGRLKDWYTLTLAVADALNDDPVALFDRAARAGVASPAALEVINVFSQAAAAVARTDGAMERLRAAADGADTGPLARHMAQRLLGDVFYTLGDFESAYRNWRTLSDQNVDDWQLANNAAYIVATNLGRPEEAVPLIERALTAVGRIPEVLSTQSRIETERGNFQEAIDAAMEGLVKAPAPRARLALLLNCARAHIAKGDRERAGYLLNTASTLLAGSANLRREFSAEYEELRTRASSAD